MNNKITLKIIRCFALGFTVFSPKFNGFAMEINIACFSIQFWSSGQKFIGFENYWHG